MPWHKSKNIFLDEAGEEDSEGNLVHGSASEEDESANSEDARMIDDNECDQVIHFQ